MSESSTKREASRGDQLDHLGENAAGCGCPHDLAVHGLTVESLDRGIALVGRCLLLCFQRGDPAFGVLVIAGSVAGGLLSLERRRDHGGDIILGGAGRLAPRFVEALLGGGLVVVELGLGDHAVDVGDPRSPFWT